LVKGNIIPSGKKLSGSRRLGDFSRRDLSVHRLPRISSPKIPSETLNTDKRETMDREVLQTVAWDSITVSVSSWFTGLYAPEPIVKYRL
jgi:hypothetical protein